MEVKKLLSKEVSTLHQTAKELEDKYGNGNIDLDKGEFTPIA